MNFDSLVKFFLYRNLFRIIEKRYHFSVGVQNLEPVILNSLIKKYPTTFTRYLARTIAGTRFCAPTNDISAKKRKTSRGGRVFWYEIVKEIFQEKKSCQSFNQVNQGSDKIIRKIFLPRTKRLSRLCTFYFLSSTSFATLSFS